MNGLFDDDMQDSRSYNERNKCSLIDDSERCSRSAGNASYSKRIQKTAVQRKLKLHLDSSAGHIYICDFHKNMIQSARTKRNRRDSEDSNEQDYDDVDLYQLQVATLRRYKKHYKVPTKPSFNKAQLADTLTKHFRTIPIVEKEALTYFIYMIKMNKNRLDQRNGSGNDTS